MKSRLARSMLVGLALSLSFLAGAAVSARGAWWQPLAVVTIENRSGQPLRSLELRFESASAQAVLRLPALRDAATVDAHVPVRGEGSYTVRAVLSDGTPMQAVEGYVEAGYRVTEVVESARAARPARGR